MQGDLQNYFEFHRIKWRQTFVSLQIASYFITPDFFLCVLKRISKPLLGILL